jgi:hypothetical protein
MRIHHWNGANLLLASLGLLIVPASSLGAKDQVARNIEGSWQGDFGAGQWTFTFVRAKGGWSGKYTYPQYKGWNPVTKLAASDGAAKFSINAKSSVDFNLRLAGSKNLMSGTVRFGQGKTPGSDPVVVPVQLKRVS